MCLCAHAQSKSKQIDHDRAPHARSVIAYNCRVCVYILVFVLSYCHNVFYDRTLLWSGSAYVAAATALS